jgi:hypothetical protein
MTTVAEQPRAEGHWGFMERIGMAFLCIGHRKVEKANVVGMRLAIGLLVWVMCLKHWNAAQAIALQHPLLLLAFRYTSLLVCAMLIHAQRIAVCDKTRAVIVAHLESFRAIIGQDSAK